MPDPRLQITATRAWRFPITIPAAASTDGATLKDLLEEGGYDARTHGELVGVKVLGLLADGTDRGAIEVANTDDSDAFDEALQPVPAGEDYAEAATDDALSAVRAASGAAIDAIAVAYCG